jgi:Tol biopolymer transport system component
MIGKTISHYKIIEEIGRGGMGMVYKAEDTKLNRTVALKFLPPELTHNQESKQRFIREAQAASALEHPNICNIHEIDETKLAPGESGEGQLFIVMACYEGETLKGKIKDQRLKTKEAVDITFQIAEGLIKAHEKGIVHRDLKPANIFITNDGMVKILDFGLAKLAGQAQVTKDASTLGTVAYMSPEQLSGKEVDQRTDIWSLGVMLYEMLTGHLPFKGDYEQAVIYSILNEEPTLISDSRIRFPAEFEKIVHRTLIKDPEKRYQSIEELQSDLKSIEGLYYSQKDKKKLSKGKFKLLHGISVVAFFIVIFMMVYFSIRQDDTRFQIKQTIPLTTAPGLEQDPAWSPDGSRIAYAADETGNMDIWLQQIISGQKINLTPDYSGYDGKPAWSPDGEWIAFLSDREGGGIFIIPTLGGMPKRVLPLSFAPSLSRIGAIPPVCWSPDGRELTYAVEGILYSVPAQGGIPSVVPLPPSGLEVGYSEPTWSPDGKCIAYTDFVAVGVANSRIWSVQSDGTDPVPITKGKNFDHNPVWSSDGRQLFFISDRQGTHDIWWIPVDERGKPTDSAQCLTTGIGIGSIALSRDGRVVAYAKVIERSNIWSIPIVPDCTLSIDNAQALTSENHYIDLLSVSPDGQRIAFDTNRSGNQDIWVMRKDGSELRQLTTNSAHDWVGSWSPDGNQIAFHSLRQGNRDIFVMPVAGGPVVQLTSHPAEELFPIWSPDGEKITFVSNRSGHMEIWIIPSTGGEAQQLTFCTVQEILSWSPDGKRLVFSSKCTGSSELFLIPAEGGKPVQLTHGEWLEVNPFFWSSDGQMIYALGIGRQSQTGNNLWEISISDGTARSLIEFKDSMMEPLFLSSDGERLYFTLWECVGDLWMAELSSGN